MRVRDTLKLSTLSIVQYKGRSLVIVLTISVLFGLLMALNFVMNGIEKTAVEANGLQLGGKNYIVTSYASQSSHEGRYVASVDEWTAETQVLDMPERARQQIEERVAKHHGKIVGETWNIRTDREWQIVTLDAVRDFVTEDLAKVPEDKLPILKQVGNQEFQTSRDDETTLQETTYVVGTYPGVKVERDLDEYDGWNYYPTLARGNLLNFLLRKVVGGVNGRVMVIDDGSGKVERLLQQEVADLLGNGESVLAVKADKDIIVEFDNQDDAIEYDLERGMLGVSLPESNPRFYIYELFGGILYTAEGFNALRLKLLVAEILLLIVAIIIATTTFKHLLAQDVNTIALYRSMGATTRDLYLIYFLYILELCLMAVVMCIGIAFLLVGLVAMTNGAELGARLQTYYQLDQIPQVYFYRFDQYFWLTVLAILLVAPLALGFSSRCFSDTYVGKKLKES